MAKSKSKQSSSSPNGSSGIDYLLSSPPLQFFLILSVGALSLVILQSYQIRLLAIKSYGTVIHEFDPYFNFRATEYLYEHGAKKFFTWFDYMVWYPLGRPVGTTIYPGMQFTAVWIKNFIVGDNMSLNDVCCYVPAWFGVIATILTGMITYEVTLPCNSDDAIWSIISSPKKKKGEFSTDRIMSPYACGLCAMAAMAIIPAHLMRSVGGGFDNESVAMSAMLLTFYFWVRSLRVGETYGYLFGILTGVAYFYMVASWGGYVFVLNMIGLHAGLLVLLGRFSSRVYKAYSLFYVVGTLLAIQVPVVGLAPLKSLEQLGAFAVFAGFQVLQFCEITIRKKNLKGMKAMQYRIKVIWLTAIIGIFMIALCTPAGYFGPISSRIRGLFVKHTKTGNPLVDSVAEHQPAKANSYYQYLHHFCMLAPIGFLIILGQFGDGPSFISAYGLAAYFFSHKMVRLILFLAPAASILGGIALGRGVAWSLVQFWESSPEQTGEGEKKAKETKKKKPPVKKDSTKQTTRESDASKAKRFVKKTTAVVVLFVASKFYISFHGYCWDIAKHLSNPTIIQSGQTRDGKHVKVDDYREAYWWIRDNTPKDARIMSWWDYGYQLTAIANRTTIADGNTWNHEHIALLAKILTGPLDEGYEISRHLADYILVWSGGGGDDVAKSPHLARIANSVYRNMCPDDPVCSKFGFVPGPGGRKAPSQQMQKSLVYQLVTQGLMPDIEVDKHKFKEVYRTRYGKVRIYKIMNIDDESKEWASDPKNRKCDVEGGWFCRGQYPPALLPYLAEGKDFAQLEDFNRKGGEDTEYQKKYMEALHKREEIKKKTEEKRRQQIQAARKKQNQKNEL